MDGCLGIEPREVRSRRPKQTLATYGRKVEGSHFTITRRSVYVPYVRQYSFALLLRQEVAGRWGQFEEESGLKSDILLPDVENDSSSADSDASHLGRGI